MGQVLGIVYRVIATHLVKKAGYTHHTARTGAVTHIQRFGSALNFNIHLMCMDTQELPTCFSSMVCMSITSREPPGFVGARH